MKLLLLIYILGVTLLFDEVSSRQRIVSSKPIYDAKTGVGTVWPMPKSIETSTNIVPVELNAFSFKEIAKTCSLLTDAFERYEKLIKKSVGNYNLRFRPANSEAISTLYVNLTSACENFPSVEMNEKYSLKIDKMSFLESDSVWGILRGLETFSQLLWKTSTGEVVVNKTVIYDEPRFSHRGILIDTSRHYLPINVLYQILDSMEYNKMNVLHWHIVDDQSFPYISKTYPSLHRKGAYNPTNHVYGPSDVTAVVYYARSKGIRVVPEFDSPGHTQSWGKGQPNLLTECFSNGRFNGNYGPVNPINNENYIFIKNLWKELKSVFPDQYIHLGGDEVSFDCWKSNPNITAWMKEKNISGNYAKLEEYHVQKVINISNEVGFSYIVWQEVFDNGVQLKDDTVVEVWLPPADKEVAKITSLGYKTLIAAPWYLDYISYGQDWKTYYKYEPLNFNGTDEQKSLVLGGEACLWAEYVDSTNLLSRLWPRASAVAERLWSPADVNNPDEATSRLHQHRCRLLKRNIPAEPLWIGYCDEEWQNY